MSDNNNPLRNLGKVFLGVSAAILVWFIMAVEVFTFGAGSGADFNGGGNRWILLAGFALNMIILGISVLLGVKAIKKGEKIAGTTFLVFLLPAICILVISGSCAFNI